MSHQVASLNIWGWGPDTDIRLKEIKKFLVDEKQLEGAKVLMIQESLQLESGSTASNLANEMSWKSYFVKREADAEGLAFVYSPELSVIEKKYYHIKSKHSQSDYSRIALSIQIEDPVLGKIRYLNTHLAHEPYMGATRKDQIQETLDWLGGLEEEGPSSLIVMGGDFNTGPTNYYYDQEFDLLSNSLFSFQHSPHEGASYSWTNGGVGPALLTELVDHFHVSSRRPGYVLDSLKTDILTQTIEQSLSDHAFLRLTVNLKKE